MWEKIKKLFTLVEITEDKCDHDWEVLENCGIWLIIEKYYNGYSWRTTKAYYTTYPDDLVQFFGIHRKKTVIKQAQKKVCLKCGLCVDGEKAYREAWQRQKDKKLKKQQEAQRIEDERYELAKKIWEDCSEI